MMTNLPVLISSLMFQNLGAIAATPPQTPPLELPGTPRPNRFFVECHCFIPAAEGREEDFSYHFRAFGYPQAAADGLEIDLDGDRILLSIGSRKAGEEDYQPLYESIPLVERSSTDCNAETCSPIEYEPQTLLPRAIVTYDKDNGAISIRHQLNDRTLIQGKGGCVFVALPPKS